MDPTRAVLLERLEEDDAEVVVGDFRSSVLKDTTRSK